MTLDIVAISRPSFLSFVPADRLRSTTAIGINEFFYPLTSPFEPAFNCLTIVTDNYDKSLAFMTG